MLGGGVMSWCVFFIIFSCDRPVFIGKSSLIINKSSILAPRMAPEVTKVVSDGDNSSQIVYTHQYSSIMVQQLARTHKNSPSYRQQSPIMVPPVVVPLFPYIALHRLRSSRFAPCWHH